MLKLNYFVPAIALTLSLASCGGSETEKKEVATIETTEGTDGSSDDDYVLPPPISIANAFKAAGLAYKANKTNPVENADNYSVKIDQLINLGVYSTDMAYCAINSKTQEARDYLAAIQKMGSKVGLESVFSDKELITKFDKGLGDTEALTDVIYEIQDKSDEYMENNDLKYLGAIQFSGAWIEGLYLAIDNTNDKTNVGKSLVEQMSLLKNIIKGFKSHPAQEDARLKAVIKMYEGILSTYEGLASVKKVSKNINIETPQLTEAEYQALAKEVKMVRSNIVKPGK
ncbi:MAG: hypothetical protein K0S23_1371 [Fluviicola sp.]|jgi:hypothetical protein|uniref:hypothetical protein n=1 Tax=Fluviicola sp. TaxID=1917219 RepID=UPI002605CD10|nr:hypothetical protein [Fluviicola sp.]MDF3027064.1 hypothetical protein [Fluviicola sp.]